MKTKDLAQRLEVLDRTLAQRKVQLTARPFDAHRMIMAEGGIQYAPLFGRGGTPTLFEEIDNWYKVQYGERMLVDMKIGEMPFLLRGLSITSKFLWPMARFNWSR